MKERTTTIHLLRHGQTNDSGCMRGLTDVELSAAGFYAMEQVTNNDEQYDFIISSPLRRCLFFAHHLNTTTKTPLITNKQWQEINFGLWDGVPYQELWQDYGIEGSKYWENPWQQTPPQAETLVEFDHRIFNAWQQLLKEYQGKNILVITHGGVIRQIIHQILNLPKDNTHISRINLPYATKVTISVYIDEMNKQWPQLHF